MEETIFGKLIAQEEPPPPDSAPTFGKVVTVPASLALVGVVLFVALYARSLSAGRNIQLRHIGTLCVVAGLVVSGRTFLQLTDKETGEIYRSSILSQNTLIAHYAVPALLLLVLIGIGAAELHLNKRLPSKTSSSTE